MSPFSGTFKPVLILKISAYPCVNSAPRRCPCLHVNNTLCCQAQEPSRSASSPCAGGRWDLLTVCLIAPKTEGQLHVHLSFSCYFSFIDSQPGKVLFFSLNPFQSFRRRGAKSIIFWIYVLHLSVHGRRLLCQLCGQCVIRLQVEHLTGHISVPLNIAILSLIISIHSNIAGTEMQWNASTNLHSWRQMSRGW